MSLSNMERNFMLKSLSLGQRIDERPLTTFRDISFDFDIVQRGHVTAHLGKTKVLAIVTATVARPFPARPAEGQVNYFLEISPLALPLEEYPSWEEEHGRLQRLVDRILKNSRIVDTESLCIVPGEQVWNVRVDMHVLDHDGNLIEASIAAAVAALVDFRRPDFAVTEDGVKIFSAFERHPVPLALHNPAVAVSFAFQDPEAATSDHATQVSGKIISLADPSWREEALEGGSLVMAVNRHGEMVTMVKTGGEAVSLDILQGECLLLARQRAISILDSINLTILKIRGK